MAQKPSHHPKAPGAYHAPKSDKPEYIQGETGLAGFGSRSFYVAQIPRVEANAVIKQHHYSRRIVANSYVHLGVFIDGVQVGVLQFGYALNPVAGATKIIEGTQVDQYLELNRMWLDDSAPRNSESRALSYAFKFIKRACPRVAWVQSFADERCGGWGSSTKPPTFFTSDITERASMSLTGRPITRCCSRRALEEADVRSTCGTTWSGRYARAYCSSAIYI